MKKRILLVLLVAILTLGIGGYVSAAGGGTKVFSHDITIQVEPIEVQVMQISGLQTYPGRPITVVYHITNHSSQTHYNLIANLNFGPNFPANVGIGSDWKLRGQYYAPGTIFQVPTGTTAELTITIYAPDYTGEIPLNIEILRISGEEGKG